MVPLLHILRGVDVSLSAAAAAAASPSHFAQTLSPPQPLPTLSFPPKLLLLSCKNLRSCENGLFGH